MVYIVVWYIGVGSRFEQQFSVDQVVVSNAGQLLDLGWLLIFGISVLGLVVVLAVSVRQERDQHRQGRRRRRQQWTSCDHWGCAASCVLGQTLALGPTLWSPGSGILQLLEPGSWRCMLGPGLGVGTSIWVTRVLGSGDSDDGCCRRDATGASTTFLPHHHHERCADQGHLPGFPRPRGSHGLSGCAWRGQCSALERPVQCPGVASVVPWMGQCIALEGLVLCPRVDRWTKEVFFIQTPGIGCFQTF